MKTKTDLFFEMLAGQYGAGKMNSAWPTDLDIQLAKRLFKGDIERHTEQELSLALSHARRMMVSGEEEWMWPNIGLILSGAKFPKGNSPDVIALLSNQESPEQRQARKEIGRIEMDKLRKSLNLK